MKYLTALIILIPLEIALSVFFIVSLLSETGNNMLLGTILGAEFLILGSAVILYILAAVPPREIAEDRGERLLW